MKIGYRPEQPSKPAAKPAIRMGMPLNRTSVTSNRMLTETVSESDLPAFLRGDGKDTPKRAAEADWTKPYGEADD